ncbi:MAG TPA: serine/threonine-protein kinase [Polyangiaceae bacterium]|jgi:serine/threonine-protein kinase
MRILGRYRLHGELAAGGMATVHLGRLKGEAGFSRTVAIKRLHPQYAKDPEFVAMFVDEARLAARVRHPNVVPTLDVVSEGGEIFLVMEYVAGESLSRLLRTLRNRKQLVPPHIATTLLAGVLHGLHAAHEARNEQGEPLKIVHRDVSPQNVLVGTDGIAHVLDFGVAKATGRVQTTRDGQVKGKLAYMAPEQLDSGALTRQSDVYAAAVVLWETLTLTRLFEADSEPALLMKVVAGNIDPPSKLVPSLPTGLDELVMRGLERDPTRRWLTARDFALALERSGRLAPPSEIGEWVQSVAGDDLARRAQKLAEIEGGSINLRIVPPPSPEAEVTRSGVRVGDPGSTGSTVSALSMSEPAADIENPFKKDRRFLVWGGLATLVGVLLGFAVLRTQDLQGGTKPDSLPVAAAPAAPPPAVATPDLAVAPMPPSTATATPPDPSAEADTAVPAAPAAAAPRPHPQPAWSPPPRLTPPKAAASHPPADCDPPFTRDTQGHKHYKLQCL